MTIPQDRLLDVIELLAAHRGRQWGVRELAARVDMTPSTTYRLLSDPTSAAQSQFS